MVNQVCVPTLERGNEIELFLVPTFQRGNADGAQQWIDVAIQEIIQGYLAY
jgi:hypothetical protein